MSRDEKQRLIFMQRQITIAKRALEKITFHGRDEVGIALLALDQMQLVEMGKLHALETA